MGIAEVELDTTRLSIRLNNSSVALGTAEMTKIQVFLLIDMNVIRVWYCSGVD